MNILSDIYRAERPKVKAKTLQGQGLYGKTWITTHHVEIDLRRNTNPARTFLHEMIHQVRPAWTEKEVRGAERTIWSRMTQKQVAKLFKKMFR